ncbi:MAG: hypothetical protein ACJ749_10430 [Flavisolibacter sp.]
MPQDREQSKLRENAQQQTTKNPQKSGTANMEELSDGSDLLAGRDQQSHDYKGESQNVNDDAGRALSQDEMDHARNKANQRTMQDNGEQQNENNK